MKKRLMVLLLFLGLSVQFGLAVNGQTPKNRQKVEKVRISTPVATISIPMAYIVENQLLKDYAKQVELVKWDSNEQFRAQVLKGSVDFITMPVNSACLFSNKGIKLKMLKVSMWKLFYIVGKDVNVKTIRDLKGKQVVVPFRGDIPDVLFRYLCLAEKIDPFKDLNIQYVPSLLDTTAGIIGGKADCALMIEPAASMAIMKAAEKKLIIKRVIDLQDEWCRHTGGQGGIMPISGVAVLPRQATNRRLLEGFSKAYDAGVKWANEHPEAAARLVAKYFKGTNARAFCESIKYVHFESKNSGDVQNEIEVMLQAFLKTNPESIGAKLPDEYFYYK
jgi:NitT/TauT family transport system substrate-binding protein